MKTKATKIQKEDKEEIEKDREKRAIYVNKTDVTENMINEFYKFYNFKVKKLDFYTFMLCGIALIILSIIRFFKVEDNLLGIVVNIIINIFLILGGVGFIIYALRSQKYNIKKIEKVYSENMSVIKSKYYFTEDEIIIANKFGETIKLYEHLTGIYEAKTCYYLFTSRKNGYIIKKDSFTKGIEYKFRLFMKEKLGKSYKRCYRKKKRKSR